MTTMQLMGVALVLWATWRSAKTDSEKLVSRVIEPLVCLLIGGLLLAFGDSL